MKCMFLVPNEIPLTVACLHGILLDPRFACIPFILMQTNNKQKNSGSQFFICTVDTPWLDGRHCVFGKVSEGLDVVDKIESVGSQSGQTSARVVIKDCGEL